MSATEESPIASREDIKSLLGDINGAKMLEIVEMGPTVAELEKASLWLSGDPDVYGADEPLKGKAARIVSIVTEGEDEER